MSQNEEKRRPVKMSLEQALEEERLEILDLLESPKSPRSPRSAVPERRTSPARRRYGSIAGIGVGITPPSGRRASITSPLASTSPWTNNIPPYSSSGDITRESEHPDRQSSDSTAQVLREKNQSLHNRGVDIHSDYQARMEPSTPHLVLPQHTDKGEMSSESASGIPRRSKTAQVVIRSLSPRTSHTNRYVTETGRVINMNRAYKKLSDAALATSSGSLSSLPKNDAGGSGESVGEDANVRLPKDNLEGADENSEFVDSSEDDVDEISSEDDAHSSKSATEEPRGRKQETPKPPEGGWSGRRGPSPPPPGSPARVGALSLLKELEEECELSAPPRRGRSLLAPGPRKSGVHPNTSFDHNTSALNTPVGSDDEADLSDIKQAQNLSIHMSSVDTTIPDRAVRTIIRGDFPRLQQEADEGFRRQRKYLVATDLSDEAVYALEWTIGTILRDGDTLFAVYAIPDDNAGGVNVNSCVQIGDGAKVMQDTADVVGKQTERTAMRSQSNASSLIPHALAAYFGSESKSNSRSNSVDTRALSKAETERSRVIEEISQTCVRLLRKTMLQVRVAVEVIHCKSPKHLLTEAIDGLEPTLVILGSRGRSALKGVLLGSFSNYIVTKSSVPVMVARKKLKKHSKKTRIRLSNNLTTPRSLAMAKID